MFITTEQWADERRAEIAKPVKESYDVAERNVAESDDIKIAVLICLAELRVNDIAEFPKDLQIRQMPV